MTYPGCTMKKLLLATTALAALAASAQAADLPVKAPPVVVAAAFSWTGCYIGGNVGWLRTDARADTSPTGPAHANLSAAVLAANSHRYDLDDSSFTGGAQIGCNWQRATWVFGIEGDFNWTDARGSVAVSYPLTGPWIAHTETLTHRLNWFSTARLRLGVAAWERTLLYATGGLAIGRVGSSFLYVTNPANNTWFGERAHTRLGWTVGGGIEHALGNNWSVKAEYLYIDLRSFTVDATRAAAPDVIFSADVHTRVHVARLGLNYRFGAQPVIARY